GPTGHRVRTAARCAAAPDLADRARADPVSQAAQLALDPGNTPGPVLCGEPAINSAGPPPGGGRPRDRGWIPFLVTMRRGPHSNVPGVTTRCTRKPVASTPGQRREHGPIGPLEPRPGIHPAQHGDLLAQDQDLGVLRRRRPSQQRQPRQHRDTEPVDQTNWHDAHHRRTKLVAKLHTYYRYVAEELAGADVAAHVAEPAETAFARGRKQHAKTELLLGIFTR